VDVALYNVVVAVLGTSADDNVTSLSEHVDVDLRHGIVKGYSQYVTFVVSPSPTDDDRCSAQAVVRVDLGQGPFNRVKLSLDYSEPRLWTVDVSDSIHADGYGVSSAAAAADDVDDDEDDDNDAGVSNSTRGNMAETHVRIVCLILIVVQLSYKKKCACSVNVLQLNKCGSKMHSHCGLLEVTVEIMYSIPSSFTCWICENDRKQL